MVRNQRGHVKHTKHERVEHKLYALIQWVGMTQVHTSVMYDIC